MSEEVKAQEVQKSPMQELTKPSAQVSKTVLKKLKALSKDALVAYVLELSDAFEMQKMANQLLHKSYQGKIAELSEKLANLTALTESALDAANNLDNTEDIKSTDKSEEQDAK